MTHEHACKQQTCRALACMRVSALGRAIVASHRQAAGAGPGAGGTGWTTWAWLLGSCSCIHAPSPAPSPPKGRRRLQGRGRGVAVVPCPPPYPPPPTSCFSPGPQAPTLLADPHHFTYLPAALHCVSLRHTLHIPPCLHMAPPGRAPPARDAAGAAARLVHARCGLHGPGLRQEMQLRGLLQRAGRQALAHPGAVDDGARGLLPRVGRGVPAGRAAERMGCMRVCLTVGLCSAAAGL